MTRTIEIACIEHIADLLKVAMESAGQAPGKGEKYAPWYGAAALGGLGHHLGGLASPKHKLFGSIAGSLAGTAAGVHGGEAMGRALDNRMMKGGSAEEPQQEGPQEPNYNQTLRDIAKRKAIVTAKEIGAISLPMIAGVGAGMGYEKFMASRGGSAPAARKLMAYGALPLVGGTAALAYRAAQHLKENEFARIREEEMAKYDKAMRDYHAQLQRNPQPEGLG